MSNDFVVLKHTSENCEHNCFYKRDDREQQILRFLSCKNEVFSAKLSQVTGKKHTFKLEDDSFVTLDTWDHTFDTYLDYRGFDESNNCVLVLKKEEYDTIYQKMAQKLYRPLKLRDEFD